MAQDKSLYKLFLDKSLNNSRSFMAFSEIFKKILRFKSPSSHPAYKGVVIEIRYMKEGKEKRQKKCILVTQQRKKSHLITALFRHLLKIRIESNSSGLIKP